MATTDLTALIEPLLGPLGVELWDVEESGGVLRVAVDRPGGIDLDAIAAATRAVSGGLDEADPIAGRYTLGVSSPGVERRLRTPAHFRRTIGAEVNIKTVAGFDGPRRLLGTLESADDQGIRLAITGGDAEAVVAAESATGSVIDLAYGDIERARTVFAWGAAGPARSGNHKGRKRKAAS